MQSATFPIVHIFNKQIPNFAKNMNKWTSIQENLSSGFANSKGTDQLVHPSRLISTLAIRLLESIVSNLLQVKFQFSSYPL